MNKKRKKQTNKQKSGYTLVEVAISVLLFSIVMVIVMGVTANIVVVKNRIQSSAQNLEDARFAMETMAKTLRGSVIFSCNDGEDPDCTASSINSIETYDYSQGKCIRYKFNPIKKIIYSYVGTGDSAGCVFSSSAQVSMVNENSLIESLKVNVEKTSSTAVGKVTIFLEVCSKYNKGECVSEKSDNFPIQTTVSLRY
jgi:prepilin-type N-terminal cleavage/methylation domain-containing protein